MIKMKLHLLMAEKRLNMTEVAEATGIRVQTIRNYHHETYVYIHKEHLDILCKYFDCSISDLIEYIPDEPK